MPTALQRRLTTLRRAAQQKNHFAVDIMRTRPGKSAGIRALAFWMLALLFTTSAFAQQFDRAAQAQRYRAWQQQFETDFATLQQRRRAGAQITEAQIEQVFAKSVVPESRAVPLLKALAEQSDISAGSGFAVVGAGRIFFDLLRDAVPAGDGGIYPENEATIGAHNLSVWYMHINGGGGDTTERYFSDPKRFEPYRLPPAGRFERRAYPFLLMDDKSGALRLGGVSAEFWNLVSYLHATQFQ
ncbi:hypothetical protein [Cupriavidus basilensis]|uniref:hypothetical protein n=1 Tax=Cupriavidus basilensis TaxID=68895 RepID=UPI0039F64B2D